MWLLVGLHVGATGQTFLPLGSNHCLPFSPWLTEHLLRQFGANDSRM